MVTMDERMNVVGGTVAAALGLRHYERARLVLDRAIAEIEREREELAKSPWLNLTLVQIGVSLRLANALERDRHVVTVGDLLQVSRPSLEGVRGVDSKQIAELFQTLAAFAVGRLMEQERLAEGAGGKSTTRKAARGRKTGPV